MLIDFLANLQAKWDAWKTLGDMDKGLAQDLYVELVDVFCPGWKEEKAQGENFRIMLLD